MAKTKNQTFFDAHQLILHTGLALRGRTDTPTSLSSEEFNESGYLKAYGSLDFFMSFYYVTKLGLLYLFGDYEAAARMAEKAERVADKTAGMIWDAWRCFYQALTLAALYPSLSHADQRIADESLAAACSQLQTWAENSPQNFSHWAALLGAETAAVRGDVVSAMDGYERAIAEAARHGFVHVEALTNECYARFWQARGNDEITGIYLRAAERCYSRWGASAKVEDLKKRHPHQLATTRRYPENLPSLDSLDTTTVMRAAQLMSAEMEQSRLIGKLLRIVLENAGAERGFLLLERQGQLLIVAKGTVATAASVEFPATAAAFSQEIPTSVIHYVTNSSETVVLADASRDSRFAIDPYIQDRAPLSVLC